MSHSTDVAELLTSVRKHFADINRDSDLIEDDKKRLKEFYLEELITPKVRTLLLEHFPDEFKDLDLSKGPDRQTYIWIDPQSDALSFLRKDKTPAS
jgi:hypothetical protein